MANPAATLQAEFQKTLDSFREMQMEMQKINRSRQQFLQQQHENEMVLNELEMLDDDARVFKQIGPALVRQDQMEASANVKKRLEFIAAEVGRLDKRIEALEEKASKKQEEAQQLQAEMARLKAQIAG